MSKRGPAKKTKNQSIRTFILGESERTLRSGTRLSMMAGSGETEGQYNDNESDKSSSALAETLARMDSTLSQVKTSIEDNHSAIIEVKTEVTKTDVKVEKVCNSVESLTEEIKTLTVSKRKLEIEQIKVSDKISVLEKQQLDQERLNEDLKKNVEIHDSEIAALRAELAEYKASKVVTDKKIEVLEKENADHKIADETREQYHRKHNLWFYGLQEVKDGENKEIVWQTVSNFCINVLKIDQTRMKECVIKNAQRVGDPKVSDRPLIVAFCKWDDRQLVLRAASILFQFNKDNKTRFAVKTDLAPLAREKRKKYYNAANKMRELRKYPMSV